MMFLKPPIVDDNIMNSPMYMHAWKYTKTINFNFA